MTPQEKQVHSVPGSCFLIPFSGKNLGSLEKRPNLGPGQEEYKMNPEHFVVLEIKEVFKNYNNNNKGWDMSKGHQSQLRGVPSGQS